MIDKRPHPCRIWNRQEEQAQSDRGMRCLSRQIPAQECFDSGRCTDDRRKQQYDEKRKKESNIIEGIDQDKGNIEDEEVEYHPHAFPSFPFMPEAQHGES